MQWLLVSFVIKNPDHLTSWWLDIPIRTMHCHPTGMPMGFYHNFGEPIRLDLSCCLSRQWIPGAPLQNVSPATSNILQKLPTPITLTYIFQMIVRLATLPSQGGHLPDLIYCGVCAQWSPCSHAMIVAACHNGNYNNTP